MRRKNIGSLVVKRAITLAMAFMMGFAALNSASLITKAEEVTEVSDVVIDETPVVEVEEVVVSEAPVVEQTAEEQVKEAIEEALTSTDALQGSYPVIDEKVETVVSHEFVEQSEAKVEAVNNANEAAKESVEATQTAIDTAVQNVNDKTATADAVEQKLTAAQELINATNESDVVTSAAAAAARDAYEEAASQYENAEKALADAEAELKKAEEAAKTVYNAEIDADIEAAKAAMDKAANDAAYAKARMAVATNLLAEATKKVEDLEAADTKKIKADANEIFDIDVEGKVKASEVNKKLDDLLANYDEKDEKQVALKNTVDDYKAQIASFDESVNTLKEGYELAETARTEFRNAASVEELYSTGAYRDVECTITHFDEAVNSLLSSAKAGNYDVAKNTLNAIEAFRDAETAEEQFAAMDNIAAALSIDKFTDKEVFNVCVAFNYNLKEWESVEEIRNYMSTSNLGFDLSDEFWASLDDNKYTLEHNLVVNWINVVNFQAKALLDTKDVAIKAVNATEASAKLIDVLPQGIIEEAQQYFEQQSILTLVSVGYNLDIEDVVLPALALQIKNASDAVDTAKVKVDAAKAALDKLQNSTKNVGKDKIEAARKRYEDAKSNLDDKKQTLNSLEETVKAIESKVPSKPGNPSRPSTGGDDTPTPAPSTPSAPAAPTVAATVVAATPATPAVAAPARRAAAAVNNNDGEAVEDADDTNTEVIADAEVPLDGQAEEEIAEEEPKEEVRNIEDEEVAKATEVKKFNWWWIILFIIAVIAATFTYVKTSKSKKDKAK